MKTCLNSRIYKKLDTNRLIRNDFETKIAKNRRNRKKPVFPGRSRQRKGARLKIMERAGNSSLDDARLGNQSRFTGEDHQIESIDKLKERADENLNNHCVEGNQVTTCTGFSGHIDAQIIFDF